MPIALGISFVRTHNYKILPVAMVGMLVFLSQRADFTSNLRYYIKEKEIKR